MSNIILRGCWCDDVMNVHVPSEDKTDDMRNSFYKDIQCAFNKLAKNHMEI
jgi:hypothetical protein